MVSRDLTVPGFHHDQHSMAHIFIQANPLLVDDELQLKARYGLKYLFPDPPVTSLFEDGQTPFVLSGSGADLRRYREVLTAGCRRLPPSINAGSGVAADDCVDIVFGAHVHG